MKRLFILPVLLLTLMIGNPASSADFQKGLDAAQRGDFATALKEWKPLAEQGHANSQFYLGWMYDNGQGVPQDHKTAVKWYTRAATGRCYCPIQSGTDVLHWRRCPAGLQDCC